jgi:phosphatidylglycerophosphate synthase
VSVRSLPPAGGEGWWRRLEEARRRNTRATAYFWTHGVNHRLGAALALRLRETRVTPNQLTVAAALIYVPVAAYVGTLRAPVPPLSALGVFVAVQVAYTLDCSDGLLARMRNQVSAFGGWLDRVCDFCAHTLLLASLLVFVVRALQLDGTDAVLLSGFVIGIHLTQLFATFYRTAVIGDEPASRIASSRVLTSLQRGMQLTDYGVVVLVLCAALLYPPALLAALLGYTALLLGMLLSQIGVNWPQREA